VRIPNINQTGVPGAEQLSLGAISSAAQAKMRTSQALTKVVDDYQAKVQKAETDEEYSRLTNSLDQAAADTWRTIQDAPAVDENGDPTHGAMIEQFNTKYKQIVKSHSDRVKMTANKSAISQASRNLLTQYTHTINGEMSKRSVAHLGGAYEQSRIDLMTATDGLEKFKQAQSEALATNLISPAKQVSDLDAFRQEYSANQIKSDFQLAHGAKEGGEFAENLTYPEWFDQGEQDSLNTYMQVILGRDQAQAKADERKVAADLKAEQALLTDEAKRHQKVITSGAMLADGFVESYIDLVGQITNPEDQRDLQNSLKWYADGQSLLHSENSSLDNLIEAHGTLSAAAVGDVTEGERRDALVNMLDGAISAINKDPQQAAVNMGLLKPQQSTLREAIESGDISSYLEEQVTRKALVDEHWGINTSLFKDDEIDALSKHLDSAQGYGTLESLMKATESNAHDLLSKIFTKGYRTLAVVGDLMSQADAGLAVELVHNGKKLADGEGGLGHYGPSKDEAKSLFDDYIIYSPTFGDKIDLFEGDHEIKQGMLDAVKFAYAGLSMRAGDNSGDFNEDRYEEALQAVVGNVYERHGYMFVTPRRGMKEYHVGMWLKRMDESDFSGMDADLNWEQIKKELRSGDVALVPNGEQGRYMLSRNGMFIKDDQGKGEDYVLEYKD